jgi:hypothetical protein
MTLPHPGMDCPLDVPRDTDYSAPSRHAERALG